MDTIAFFNNKGGVGKTTLACNFAAYVAQVSGMSVTVIDLDPQSNATQLLLPDEVWSEIYEDMESSYRKSILHAFSSIIDGDSNVLTDVKSFYSERFKVNVIAGHPGLSRVEDSLSRGWTDLRANEPGGARKTNWLTTLRSSVDSRIVILDLGPSLGALNRSSLIGSTHYVTPLAADLFSLYSIENIDAWMGQWIADYEEAIQRTIDKNPHSPSLDKFPDKATVQSGYLGYTVQQYVARTTRQGIRPTVAYDRYRRQIPDKISGLAGSSILDIDQLDLGTVPNMFSMVPLAQYAHAPIYGLTAADGVRGAQVRQRERYSMDLDSIFERIMSNLSLTHVD